MKIKKIAATTAVFLGVSGAGLLASQAVFAQGSSGQDNLIDKLATKFDLNKDEVKQVFDEEHAIREEKRAEKLSQYLQTKVDDGTITESQKSMVESKLEELKNKREEFKNQNITHEQLHEEMKKQKAELDQWAKDNNIPVDLLKPRFGRMGHSPHYHNNDHDSENQ